MRNSNSDDAWPRKRPSSNPWSSVPDAASRRRCAPSKRAWSAPLRAPDDSPAARRLARASPIESPHCRPRKAGRTWAMNARASRCRDVAFHEPGALEAQRRRVAVLQGKQPEIRAADNAGCLARHGDHPRHALGPLGRYGHDEAGFAEVRDPGRAPFQEQRALFGRNLHVQLFDAGQELHRVGEAGCTRQAPLEQCREPALARRHVRTCDGVLDECPLAPEHERDRQRVLSQRRKQLDRVSYRATEPAELPRHSHAEQLVVCEQRHDSFWIGATAIERVRFVREPLAEFAG